MKGGLSDIALFTTASQARQRSKAPTGSASSSDRGTKLH